MVLRACRAGLRDGHDAEDAFQATFLVLVRRCGTLWVRESLGPWLHRVASRVAIRAQAAAIRRERHERQASASRVEAREGSDPQDIGPILHAEIDRLPERYRGPVVLCDLEGRTHEEAAEQLGCPIGTVKSRLSRARERLRLRLARRGVIPAAGGLGTLLTEQAASAVSSKLALATAEAANQFAASGKSAAGTVPAAVVTLAEGVVNAMAINRLVIPGLALLLGMFITTGVLVLAADRSAATRRTSGRSSTRRSIDCRSDTAPRLCCVTSKVAHTRRRRRNSGVRSGPSRAG
jgi:RNA polymerase sigma-70 factor (ECF subfamily)